MTDRRERKVNERRGERNVSKVADCLRVRENFVTGSKRKHNNSVYVGILKLNLKVTPFKTSLTLFKFQSVT